MKKAYLKRFSAGYIKGRGPRVNWGGHTARVERAEELKRGEIHVQFSNGQTMELWKSGPNPRVKVIEKMTSDMVSSVLTEQTDRSQKRKQYNKVVLKSTAESTVTMYFSGADVFLIEDYPDGSYRQSLQASSTTRMKRLFIEDRVPWN